MKLIHSFQALSTPKKILILALVLPIVVVLAGPVTTIFGLPIIGYAVSRNSWQAGRRSKDNWVNLTFALTALAALALYLTLRSPIFITDWEGGNPLDNLIMFMVLCLMALVAATWGLAGWVGHRFVMNLRARKS
ncbi:MAG: hypothetical protein K9G66_00480 [Rhodoluna sp.]|nr:hypothetical protein [Rhodoluna sp.]